MSARKHNVARRPFLAEEDALLISLVESGTFGGWDTVSQHFQGRTSRQCRERWINYLSPTLRTQPWTEQEDEALSALVRYHGHRWSTISRLLTGRSENDVKNRWYWHVGPRGSEDLESYHWEARRRKHPRVDARENALRLLGEFPSADSSTAVEIGRCEDRFDDSWTDSDVNLFTL
jgi:hypothetical protein